MSITSILNIAKNSLLATQTSIQTTSHNIANVNTKGYSRQEAVLEEATPIPTDIGFMGDGVRVKGIIRYADKHLENVIADKNSSLDQYETVEKYLTRIESVYNDNNSQLSSKISQFFNGWHDLSTDPTSVPVRTNIAMKGENLARTIRDMYDELKGLQLELDNNITREVGEINNLLKSIAELNNKVFQGGISGGEAGDYMDQRAELFKSLSGKMDVMSVEDPHGRLTILTGQGKVLVDGNQHWDLAAIQNGQTGFQDVAWTDSSGNKVDITGEIRAGKLKALMDTRDSTIGDTLIGDLDELARSLMTEVNQIHRGGVNLNGTTDVPFFTVLTGDYAKDMRVNQTVAGDVRNIASTSSALNPTDNDIAVAMAALGEQTLSINGMPTTFGGYVASMVSDVGQLTSNAKDAAEYERDTMQIMEKQREAISGVSIDEEMANLIKFQHAYTASARLFTIADKLFETLVNMV